MDISLLLTALVLTAILLYMRTPLYAWSLAIGALVLLPGYAGLLSTPMLVLSWSVLILVIAPLNIAPLRRALISNRALALFRTLLPHMSQTEREALEAGTVWWEGELFSGRPRWRNLADIPAPRLTEEEQAFLDGPVETLCHMINDWQITHEDWALSPDIWKFIKEQGFFGMIIPKEYGGLGFSALTHSSVVLKLASRSVSAAVTVMVPNSLGPAELLLRYGSDDQKNHYLPRLARGEEVPCFALTGPEAGSDAGAMKDHGIVCRQDFEGRQDVTGIRLNWNKRYITLGPVATVLGLAFKLYDPDHLLGDETDRGITLALIPTDIPGVSIGRRHNPLNLAFQNGPNHGRDVFIPLDWIIGGEAMIGQGWRMLMECLAAGRSISLPALGTGAGKLACRATGAYARIRRQFKAHIGRFEGVEEPLARIAGYTYLMDAARTLTAAAVDHGEQPAVVSAIVKYQLTEHMRKVVNDAMDIQGGAGICLGPRNFMGRIYQALPISITVEGANILTRTLIIYGQGAVRCHPYVYREMQAARSEDRQAALRDFDRALFGHIGLVLSNTVRTIWLGLTDGRLAPVPGDTATRRHYQRLERMSAAFALVSDLSMLLIGGGLKRREKLTGRLADALSFLYLGSAMLKRFEEQGRPAADRVLLDWGMAYALHTIQTSLDALLRNFPFRPAAWLLRRLVFPFGRRYHAPGDYLGHRVAELLLEPSEARDRLTAGIYISTDPEDITGRIEHALHKVCAAAPVERILRTAVRDGTLPDRDVYELIDTALQQGVIDAEAAQCMHAADTAREDVIQVDDFAPASGGEHGHDDDTKNNNTAPARLYR